MKPARIPASVVPDTKRPKHHSNTLASIIRSARMIIVAPLVAGAYQIPTLISMARYADAFKCAIAAAGTFLILTAALGLADIAISFVEGRRKG